MKYPKEYLDEIKLRLKVSQVVGKSVKLKNKGKNPPSFIKKEKGKNYLELKKKKLK